jgi:predicted nucleic acid-binding protein
VIPALVAACASLDARSPDADPSLLGLEQLSGVFIAPLEGAEQAIRLARVIARTGLDPWDAHAAAIASVAKCPILTLDGEKWAQHAHDLDEPLHYIKIEDPEDGD